MNNSLKIKKMVGIASLAAIVAVLQLIANYITFGPVSITLALIPLIIGAILYGPSGGAILGGLMGLIILTAPSTGSFLAINPIVTVLLCVIKTSVAGIVSGYIFKGLRKINLKLGVVLASLAAPIVNTGIFAVGCILFYMPTIIVWAGEGANAYAFLFLSMIGINFIVEFVINSVLSPVVLYIIKIIANNFNMGTNLD